MCIALLSTGHPRYSLIVLDNRDEFLNRPTAPAAWWSHDGTDILSGRDLLRSEKGTWLGVSKAGRIAVLTNFREDVTPPPSAISRGALIKDFLKVEGDADTLTWIKHQVEKGVDVGGFSLICGRLDARTGKPELAVFSNRAKDAGDVEWIMGRQGNSKVDYGCTCGLSNAKFSDDSDEWPKVKNGKRFLDEAIQLSQNANETEDQLIKRLLGVLSADTLPRAENGIEGGLETHIGQLRYTVFVPPLGRKEVSHLPADEIAAAKKDETAQVVNGDTAQLGVSGLYGTQKQTVVLVRAGSLEGEKRAAVRLFERTLFDQDVNPIPKGEGDRDYSFEIES